MSEHKNPILAALIATGAAPAIIGFLLILLVMSARQFPEFVLVIVVPFAALIAGAELIRFTAVFLNLRDDPRHARRPRDDP